MPNSSHAAQTAAVTTLDPIWKAVREEARDAMSAEPSLGGFLYATVLSHGRLEDSICHRLSQRLDHSDVDAGLINQTFQDILVDHPELGRAFRADLAAVFDRDPACSRYIEPLLYFKGFHALVTHRFAHILWQTGRLDFAYYLQSQSSRMFAIDIHPAARIGVGIMIDHGHAIVVGETASIGNNVSLLHGVTLGGTGKESGDRHPKVGNCVMIGAGAKILGNIRIGDCSRVAAGSVVLSEVPPNTTVAGVPARVVGPAGCSEPSRSMDQRLVAAFDDPRPGESEG
ncbi:MAG: serine O-acetyltransferase [Hyphomicrobiaceae bacterium]|nr:serine O-acetyltransferase [Hyphomicrobiaceae bacterium]